MMIKNIINIININKMRSSENVYHRILWSESSEYRPQNTMVGYRDRFKGVKEISFENFSEARELTEQCFIPWHRVVYFRNQVTGVKFWDRENKIDLIFQTNQ